eukprot:jgi/Orpsp1_1/1189965/evm.model.d7180000075818.1
MVKKKMNLLPSLLDIKECKNINSTTGMATFIMYDGSEVEIPYKTLGDPAYQQTFEELFIKNKLIKNCDRKKRLIHLLNSLLFPDAGENELRIRNLYDITEKESPFSNNKNDEKIIKKISLLKNQINCICDCWINDGNKKINEHSMFIKIELRVTAENDLELIHANQALFIFIMDSEIEKVHVITNKNSGEGLSLSISKDYNAYFLNPIAVNQSIGRNEKPIGDAGKIWLKLLSLRRWGLKMPNSDPIRYVIPSVEQNLDEEIQSAIAFLEHIDDNDLKLYIQNEKRNTQKTSISKNKSEFEKSILFKYFNEHFKNYI